MTNQEPDPISEVHAALDQLSRVAISAVLQMAELRARHGAQGVGRLRDEQVAFAKGMGAQLEEDYRGAGAVRAGQGPTPAPAITGGGAVPWPAVGDDNWWGSATGADLGRAWEAVSAQAAAGDPSAIEALDGLKRQVHERWGLTVDQDGTVVAYGGTRLNPAASAGALGAPVDQGAPDAPMAAAIDSVSDALTTASPVLPDTVEALLSNAHPLAPSEDLAAAVANRGGGTGAEARRLAVAQAVELGSQAGLG